MQRFSRRKVVDKLLLTCVEKQCIKEVNRQANQSFKNFKMNQHTSLKAFYVVIRGHVLPSMRLVAKPLRQSESSQSRTHDRYHKNAKATISNDLRQSFRYLNEIQQCKEETKTYFRRYPQVSVTSHPKRTGITFKVDEKLKNRSFHAF